METQTIKDFFAQESVKKKFAELLGKRSTSFITSVLQIVASSELLQKAEPTSIYQAAAVAATFDLPINNNLGFAYIIPFNDKKSGKVLAQFQIGYKGFIQLSQRSGQFKTISAAPIYEGQLIESDPLYGHRFDFNNKKSNTIIGYAAYFQLLNGFEKSLFMSIPELRGHASKYSQTFKKGFGLWETDFDAMAIKTVIKLLLSKFAPLSIEMQKAIITDQSLIIDEATNEVIYIDNQQQQPDKELERVNQLLLDCNTIPELNTIKNQIPSEYLDLYNERWEALNK